ncbi:MAG: NAD(P)/FAD-dependent oxidoreductase [Candidatus Omnitrophota bacterium]
MQIYNLIIVGAGPAGMLAGIRAAEFCENIAILEKNSAAGKKLAISGKGRGNLTNAGSLEDLLKAFGKNGEFLRDAFKALSNKGLMDFFTSQGVALKTERGGRVFPAGDKAESLRRALLEKLADRKVKIFYNCAVKAMGGSKKLWRITVKDSREFLAKRLILATGGASYPVTGSDGYGLKLARQMGHTVVALRPGLVPLVVKEGFIAGLAGLSLKNVRVSFLQDKKHWESEVGEMLFTHFGVSGPLILEASGNIVDWFAEGKTVGLSIDFKPGLTAEQLEQRLLRDFKDSGGKSYKNILKELLPQKLIKVFIRMSDIAEDKKANQISAVERQWVVRLLKDFRLTIVGARPLKEAIVTKGGVSLKDINPRTMESRIHKGLYFCGEMIDVDAITGGYNLQAAFSTGWLAGENAALAKAHNKG